MGPLTHSKYQISTQVSQKLQDDFLSGRPLAYMQGFAEFYQHHFYVNPSVLIPRPETELLVDFIVNDGKKYESVLDIGVGSGVILLSLLAAQKAKKGVGVDLSPAALDVAQINTRRLRLDKNIELKISDRLQNVCEKFDLIVSNPPYIKESSHRSLVHDNVDSHEPHMALYLKDSEYEAWFLEFFNGVKSALFQDGVFWMEGHELELESQAKMLECLNFRHVKIIQDLTQRPRFLKATL